MLEEYNKAEFKIKRLNEIINKRDREIEDIKFSIANILLQIKSINESNDYAAPNIKRRKISELCTDTRNELLVDELKNELSTTDKRNR